MPKAKPIRLNTRRSKSLTQERIDAELSMQPTTGLSKTPKSLKGHAIALAAWRELMQLYSETTAEIITAFDETLLVNYCLLIGEAAELSKLRAAILADLHKARERLKNPKNSADNLLMLLKSISNLQEKLIQMDARVDRKRTLIHKFGDQLYLSPRSRAGKAPPRRPAPTPKTEMDDILDEFLDQDRNGTADD